MKLAEFIAVFPPRFSRFELVNDKTMNYLCDGKAMHRDDIPKRCLNKDVTHVEAIKSFNWERTTTYRVQINY